MESAEVLTLLLDWALTRSGQAPFSRSKSYRLRKLLRNGCFSAMMEPPQRTHCFKEGNRFAMLWFAVPRP